MTIPQLPAAATTPRQDAQTPVPARYTWKQVWATVTEASDAGGSLRWIAKMLNQRAGAGHVTITHRVVQRIRAGYEPQRADIRAALGLPVQHLAPACACGEVHLRKGRCPNAPKPVRKPGPTPNQRRAARLLGCLWGAR